MSKPKLWPRNWHNKLAIILVLPFILMAITGMLFTHGPALGTRTATVNASWLPGYGGDNAKATQDVRSVVVEGNIYWVGTRAGLVRVENGQATPVPALAREDVRSLVTTPQGVLAITGKGLWREQQGEWTPILKGMVAQASGDAQTLVAFQRGKAGPVQSTDGGKSWTPLKPVLMPALKQLPASEADNRITVAQLIHDLHTGVAFVGDKGEWVWVDALGLVLLFLSGSGIYMWWVKRRAGRARAAATAGVVAG